MCSSSARRAQRAPLPINYHKPDCQWAMICCGSQELAETLDVLGGGLQRQPLKDGWTIWGQCPALQRRTLQR